MISHASTQNKFTKLSGSSESCSAVIGIGFIESINKCVFVRQVNKLFVWNGLAKRVCKRVPVESLHIDLVSVKLTCLHFVLNAICSSQHYVRLNLLSKYL